jgi:ABC-type bacteriocin/lantibiotic exporter with double-glycine peptidase domain
LHPLLNRKPSPILQSEAAECGLACLAMVAAYHGQRLTLSELRRKVAISLKGTTLKSLMAIADSHSNNRIVWMVGGEGFEPPTCGV